MHGRQRAEACSGYGDEMQFFRRWSTYFMQHMALLGVFQVQIPSLWACFSRSARISIPFEGCDVVQRGKTCICRPIMAQSVSECDNRYIRN